MSEEKPKFRPFLEGAEQLSLGVSVVVAIALGVGLGILMVKWFGIPWLLWIGVFWGIGGAALNIYKAYKKNIASLDELKDDVRYKQYQKGSDKNENGKK